MKLRIKFSKFGNMKFVGHLDFMRFFQRLIRKCKIPIRYSLGFSPHQIMSFAAPLGTGAEGFGEYMDIEVEDDLSLKEEEMRELFHSHLYEGVEILSIRRLPEGAPKAMSLVASADFHVLCREGISFEEALPVLNAAIEEWMARTVILAEKTKKDAVTSFDIKPLVFSLKAVSSKGRPAVFMHVSQGSRDNVKPALVLDALRPMLSRDDLFSPLPGIRRLELYSEEGRTLESYGEILG